MEFTKEKLDEIIVLGSVGKTLPMICSVIGITFDKLKDLRKNNPELDDACMRAQSNADAFFLAKIRADILTGKSTVGVKEILTSILEDDRPTDNEIIIRDY